MPSFATLVSSLVGSGGLAGAPAGCPSHALSEAARHQAGPSIPPTAAQQLTQTVPSATL